MSTDNWLTTAELADASSISRGTALSWYDELLALNLATCISVHKYLWHPGVVGFMISRRGRYGRAIPSKKEVVERWFEVQGNITTERESS